MLWKTMFDGKFFVRLAIATALPLSLLACASNTTTTSEPAAETTTAASSNEAGKLEIRANGEDFIRQGFVSKDGWEISFDHVYVTLAELTAYQTEPPFDAQAGSKLEAKTSVSADETFTVDLAEGDETAAPILVTTLDAPAGRYNALSWKMVPAPEGPAQGQTLVMQGTATKEGRTVAFDVKLDPALGFVCGDYVGDERKGILDGSAQTDLEATFHFDHLFGDGEAPPEDEINTGALGFDPLAALAEGDTLAIDMAGLESQLSPADYDLMLGILPSLGHVGEGHCEETELTSS